MRVGFYPFLACAVLAAACSTSSTSSTYAPSPEPSILAPDQRANVLLQSEALQQKLDFDLSQCHCGISRQCAHDDTVKYQADKQRLARPA